MADAGFCFNVLDKVGGIDLAVGVGIRDAHDFSLVFKDEDVGDLGMAAQLKVLGLPNAQ